MSRHEDINDSHAAIIQMPKPQQPSSTLGFDIMDLGKTEIQVQSIASKFGVFMAEFLLDLFVVFPLYLFKMLFESFKVIQQNY